VRLDNYLDYLARREGTRWTITEWSHEDPIPDRLYNKQWKGCEETRITIPAMDFPYKFFPHCKRMIRGESVFAPIKSKLPVGLIRALMHKHQPYHPIGTESPPIPWWRKRLDEDPCKCWWTYRSRSDFRLDLQTPYEKVRLLYSILQRSFACPRR
jgi:hypothetical protein